MYNPQLGLTLSDTMLLAIYLLLLGFEVFVIEHFLIPLRVRSPYILSFYFILTVLLCSVIVGLFLRLVLNQTGYF